MDPKIWNDVIAHGEYHFAILSAWPNICNKPTSSKSDPSYMQTKYPASIYRRVRIQYQSIQLSSLIRLSSLYQAEVTVYYASSRLGFPTNRLGSGLRVLGCRLACGPLNRPLLIAPRLHSNPPRIVGTARSVLAILTGRRGTT